MRYIDPMYEVLVYVYENYWGGDHCPGREQLAHRLGSAGFGREEIQQALTWLDGLHEAAHGVRLEPVVGPPHLAPEQFPAWPAAPNSLRVYRPAELEHLGPHGIACLCFLEDAGALPAGLRELVIDRALAVPEPPLALDDLKILIMMVYWRVGASPDLLVLDELCGDTSRRVAH